MNNKSTASDHVWWFISWDALNNLCPRSLDFRQRCGFALLHGTVDSLHSYSHFRFSWGDNVISLNIISIMKKSSGRWWQLTSSSRAAGTLAVRLEVKKLKFQRRGWGCIGEEPTGRRLKPRKSNKLRRRGRLVGGAEPWEVWFASIPQKSFPCIRVSIATTWEDINPLTCLAEPPSLTSCLDLVGTSWS